MKFSYLSLFFSLIATPTLVAAQDTSISSQLADKSLLLDIIKLDAERFMAVGERGHVLSGSNLTNTQQHVIPTKSTLTALTQNGNSIWAVGHDLTILYSPDKGETWHLQFQDITSEKPFLDVLFFSESHGIAVGAYGAFYRTRDAGVTWQKELNASLLHPDDQDYLDEIRELDGEEFYLEELASILPHFNRLNIANGVLYMVGETGLIAQSKDQGSSWERIDIDYDGSFFALANTSKGLLVAGLRGNTFLQTIDGWQSISLCEDASVNSVTVLDSNTVLALQNNGYYSTIDISDMSRDVTCADNKVSSIQIPEKASILNAISFNDQIISVSASGLSSLNNNKK